MKAAAFLPILLSIAPLVVKGFSYVDEDLEDLALREYQDLLDARAEMLEEFSTRELIEALEDRLDAREEAAAVEAAGGAPPAAGAEGDAAGAAAPHPKKHKKHHKKKHNRGGQGLGHKRKHKHKRGGKGKKKGLKGLKHKAEGDTSAYQSPPLVAPAGDAA